MKKMLSSSKSLFSKRCHVCLWGPFVSSQKVNGLRFASLNSGINAGIRRDRAIGQNFSRSNDRDADHSNVEGSLQRRSYDETSRPRNREWSRGAPPRDDKYREGNFQNDRAFQSRDLERSRRSYSLNNQRDDRSFQRRSEEGFRTRNREDGRGDRYNREKFYQRDKAFRPRDREGGRESYSRGGQYNRGSRNQPKGRDRNEGSYLKSRVDHRNPSSVQVNWDDSALVRRVFLVPPPQIPYTKPESEFIYGASAVQAAVRCGRRTLHTLYIYEENRDQPISETRWGDPQMRTIQKYASLAGANVKHVTGPWSKCLLKMSGGRPNNGIVLEASPLPKLPVLSLQPVSSATTSHFNVQVASQSKEEEAVNGTDGSIPFALQGGARLPSENSSHPPRYPFVILLDGVLDPGNVGAIIRSAYFFGVDAIAFTSQNSAPLSPVTIKSSAGSAENIPFMAVRDIKNFLSTSHANGWRFYAAEVPENTEALENDSLASNPPVLPLESLPSKVRESPCVLMLGSESKGLQRKVKNQTDGYVTIPGIFSGRSQQDSAEVDSLNVSVASSILCEAFLSRPPTEGASTKSEATSPSTVPDNETTEDDNRVF